MVRVAKVRNKRVELFRVRKKINKRITSAVKTNINRWTGEVCRQVGKKHDKQDSGDVYLRRINKRITTAVKTEKFRLADG